MKKPVCMIPWLSLWPKPTGEVYPCCAVDVSKINLGNLNDITLKEAFQGERMNELRKLFLTGRMDEEICTKCISREATQGSSMRTMINDMFKHRTDELVARTAEDGSVDYYDLLFVDFVWSNKCNFKCVHCNPSVSSSIAMHDELKEFYNYPGPTEISIGDTPGVLDSFLEGIENLEVIHFNGGEPFMIEDHYEILDYLIKKGKTDIRLWIHTNGSMTGYKGRNIIDYIKHFPNTKISASHDGFGPRGEYVRHGYSDKKFLKTVGVFKEHKIPVEAALSVHALNVWHLPDMLEWYKQHDIVAMFNVVTDPQHIRFDVHDPETRSDIAAKLQSYADTQDDFLKDRIGRIAKSLLHTREIPEKNYIRLKKYLDIKLSMKQNAYEYFPEYGKFFQTIGWNNDI